MLTVRPPALPLGAAEEEVTQERNLKTPPTVLGEGIKDMSCHIALGTLFLLCPWKAPVCFLQDVKSFHTERFFFISLGRWDTWRLCFEMHVLTYNYTALPPCVAPFVRSLSVPAVICSCPLHSHWNVSLPLRASQWLVLPREKWFSKGAGIREESSGLPWLPRRAGKLEGAQKRCPWRVILVGKLLFGDTCSTACPLSTSGGFSWTPQRTHQRSPASSLPGLHGLGVAVLILTPAWPGASLA